MCLDPLLNKRVKANYQEHTNEDVNIYSDNNNINHNSISLNGFFKKRDSYSKFSSNRNNVTIQPIDYSDSDSDSVVYFPGSRDHERVSLLKVETLWCHFL